MWVVKAFETNKRNMNVDHITNEIHLLTSKESKNLVCIILCELERLANNAYSAQQNAFLVHHQNLLTGKFPVYFTLHYVSSK
jgi:hypothetical protein